MRRRAFLGAIGAAAAWPVLALAQVAGRVRRIGVLVGGPDDLVFQSKFTVFRQSLEKAGWTEHRAVEFHIRYGNNNAERLVTESHELVREKPDAILAGPTNALLPLRKETSSIPIVFVQVSDPVGQGIVPSLARPSVNITGYANLDFSLLGKWLQTLKEVAPATKRAAVLIHTSNAASPKWFGELERVAQSLAMEPIAAPYSEADEIEPVISKLGSVPNGALICPGDSRTDSPPIRAHIIELTAKHRLPTLHSQREFVTSGGLMSYGIDLLDQYRLAGDYVDRILRGEAPSDLPIQRPTKFNLVINLKTAKALGLTVPATLLVRADEVIE
jgi:putative ABC transport system substrate-binding protein